jgi:hypothetical protein
VRQKSLDIPGIVNIADFLTKALPLSRHNALGPFLALDPADDVDTLVRAKIKLSSMLFAAVFHSALHQASSECVDATVVGSLDSCNYSYSDVATARMHAVL